MACPQIYFGPNRFATPLAPDYLNVAIQLSDEPIVLEEAVLISVFVSNHGDASPPTSLELYWTAATTGFIPDPSQLIGKVVFPAIPGASVAAEGAISVNFGWIPTRDVFDATDGSICLLARLTNLTSPGCECTQQIYNSSEPATDPLSAMYNLQIVLNPPDPDDPRDARSAMYFAFAATNTLYIEDTVLSVRVLDPQHDRAKLAAIVARPSVDRTLSQRNLKFGVPNSVQIAPGRESVIVPSPSTIFASSEQHVVHKPACRPRISRLGAISARHAPRLIAPHARFLEATHGPVEMNLLHGEQRQTFIRVEPCKNENVVYAVEVAHSGVNGQAIGGLILLFVPPHTYF